MIIVAKLEQCAVSTILILAAAVITEETTAAYNVEQMNTLMKTLLVCVTHSTMVHSAIVSIGKYNIANHV